MAQYNHETPTPEKKSSPAIKNTEEVRQISMSEYLGATQCLAEAFEHDHVAQYFIDTEDMAEYSAEHKWKLHNDLIQYNVVAHCYKGIVTTIGPNYDAVALWMPPGKNIDDWWTIFRSGMWRLYYKLSREGRMRFFSEFFPLLHSTKAEVLGQRDDDSYYLVYVGSKPSARGKGYAKKLIEAGTRMADTEGRATYLESSSVSNVSYYRKLGFEVKKEILLTRDKEPITLQIMVREPVSEPVSEVGCGGSKGT